MFRFISLSICFCLILFSSPSSVLAKRVALIIGNSTYEHAPVLPNPANDTADVAAAFSELGYEVQLLEDATRGDLLDALKVFRSESLGAEHSIIYYAGHGVEIDRQNYLIPIDAKLSADIDVEYEAIPLDLLVVAASGAKNLQLVVLDACRDNPFLEQMTRTVATRSIGRGLATFEPAGNSLVAYSAREGTVALDGSGKNSPYATAFLSALKQPDLEIGQFFRHVRDNVIQVTKSKQEPFLYGSLSSKPVFFSPQGRPPAQNLDVAKQAPETQISKEALLSIELSFWESIRDGNEPTDFEDYIDRYPNGQFRSLAQRRLAALSLPDTPRKVSPVLAPNPLSEPEIKLSRAQTRDLQARLNILGHRAGIEDGLIGNRTLSAISKFQSSVGVESTGEINQGLIDMIASKVSASRLASHRAQAAQKVRRVSKPRVQTKTVVVTQVEPVVPQIEEVPVVEPIARSSNGRVLSSHEQRMCQTAHYSC